MPGQRRLAENNQCFINQYVVDTDDQTSGFARYSLTYAGADLAGLNTPDGAVPGRWWTDYLNSNAEMREYASSRGVPASAGSTTLEITDGILTATTSADGAPVIRTTVRVGDEIPVVGRGQLRYITDVKGQLTSGLYPFVAGIVQPWEVLNFDFIEPNHPVYALRPADPLQVTWGFYAQRVLLLPRRRERSRSLTCIAVGGRSQLAGPRTGGWDESPSRRQHRAGGHPRTGMSLADGPTHRSPAPPRDGGSEAGKDPSDASATISIVSSPASVAGSAAGCDVLPAAPAAPCSSIGTCSPDRAPWAGLSIRMGAGRLREVSAGPRDVLRM